MPWPRAASSTITSSIQARTPVGIGNITSDKVPSDPPVGAGDEQRGSGRAGHPLPAPPGQPGEHCGTAEAAGRRTPRLPHPSLRAAPRRSQSPGHFMAPAPRIGGGWCPAPVLPRPRFARDRAGGHARGRRPRSGHARGGGRGQATPRARRPAAVTAATTMTTRNGARSTSAAAAAPGRPAEPGRWPGTGRGPRPAPRSARRAARRGPGRRTVEPSPVRPPSRRHGQARQADLVGAAHGGDQHGDPGRAHRHGRSQAGRGASTGPPAPAGPAREAPEAPEAVPPGRGRRR